MKIHTLLGAIGSTEPSTFEEVLQALGDEAPARGEKKEWFDFFTSVNAAEKKGLIEVEKQPDGKKVESMILTEAGVARLKEIRKDDL